jgi:mono/diheme cytochrome c family protein
MRFSWTQRVVVGFAFASLVGIGIAAQSSARGNSEAAKVQNPVPVSAASIAAGEKSFLRYCQGCHGASAKGGYATEAAPAAPDLTDAKWERGASDGEIYDVIKNGAPPEMFMAPFDSQISSTEIWNLVNYIRSLGPKK